jgi:anti-sigma factor (TIGR02949 family)
LAEVSVECFDSNTRLDAYLDGELEAVDATSVRQHLDTCASCRQLLEHRQALGRLVRRAPYYAAPPALRRRIEQSRPPRRWPAHWSAWAAAVLLIASLAGSLLLVRRSTDTRTPVDTVAEAVVDSHVRALMGEHLFDVRSTDQHTVKPWFLGKLDFSPPVDDLARLGYPLEGGRLDYVAGRPAAALVYRRGQHTLNVFVWPAAADAPHGPVTRAIRGFHLRYWTRAAMSFWAVSDLNDLELDQFVRDLRP